MRPINLLNKIKLLHVIIILGILGFLCYGNAIHHPFVHDDVVFIENNPYIGDLNPQHIFFQTSQHDPNYPLVNTYYRPLLEVINRGIFKLFGMNPYAFHFVNVLLHIGVSFLVFIFLKNICGKNRIFYDQRNGLALCAAILFLVHPLQSESVACISGISNLVFALFCILSFHLYITSFSYYADVNKRIKKDALENEDLKDEEKAQESKNDKKNAVMFLTKEQILSSPLLSRHLSDGSSPIMSNQIFFEKFHPRSFGFSLFMFFMALFAKEQAVILPVLIIFYDVCFSKRKRDVLKKVGVYGAYLIILLGYLLTRKIIFGHTMTSMTIFNSEFVLRIMSIPRTLLMYFSLLFFPQGLHYYRSTDMLGPFWIPAILLCVILATVIFLTGKIKMPEKRLAIFGFGLFGISLLPTLNIVPLVNEYSLLLTAEHFLYLPLLGMLIFVLTLINAFLKQKPQWNKFLLRVWGAVLLTVIFMVLTIKQNAYWRGEIPLFERTLKYHKEFGRVRNLLAKAYYFNGQYDLALEEFQKSREIMEGYMQKVKDQNAKKFYQNFVNDCYQDIAHSYEALGEFNKTYPYYEKALKLSPDNAAIYHNMGVNALKQKDTKKALTYFKKSLESDRTYLMAANSLAICYEELGQLEKAETYFRYVVEKDPESPSAKRNLEQFLINKSGQ